MVAKARLTQFVQNLPPSLFKDYLQDYIIQLDNSGAADNAELDLTPIIRSWPMPVRVELKRQCAMIILRVWGEDALASVDQAVQRRASPALFSPSFSDESDTDSGYHAQDSDSDSDSYNATQDSTGNTRWQRYVNGMSQQTARRYLDTFRFDFDFNQLYGDAAHLAMSEANGEIAESIHSSNMADNAAIDYRAALLLFPQALRVMSVAERFLGLSDDEVMQSSHMPEFHNPEFGK